MFLSNNIIKRFKEKSGIDDDLMDILITESDDNPQKLAITLINKGYLSRDVAGMILGDAYGCAYINLDKTLVESDVVNRLSPASAEELLAIPIYKFGNAVTVAMNDPADLHACQRLRAEIGEDVDFIFTLPDERRC